MTVMNWASLGLVVGLGLYLMVALLAPERFD
jgi:K+-transporting ATPase KdpF subunit